MAQGVEKREERPDRREERPDRREPLSRDRVVVAAIHVMDSEGLDAVTMRRLGRELGVEAMSLYHHVKDKDDLFDGIVEQVMSEFAPPPSRGDWREDAKNAAREWRRMLGRHPEVMTLMAERRKPLANPDALIPMDAALGVVRRAGLDVRDAVQAFHAFGGYIMGFVMMEQGMMLGHGASDEEHLREHREFAELVDRGALPNLRECLPVMHDCAADEQFEFGLELMVSGLERRVEIVASDR